MSGMVEDAVYDVGIRRVVNRPSMVTVERLRFVGIGSGKSMWMPVGIYEAQSGQKVVHLAIEQIATIEEVDA